jgi:hypothetical protein
MKLLASILGDMLGAPPDSIDMSYPTEERER